MNKEQKTIKAIPTLKQYLEDMYKSDKLEFPIGYSVWKQIENIAFSEIEKENKFRNEQWFCEHEPQIRELLQISIIQTIKIIQHYEQNKIQPTA